MKTLFNRLQQRASQQPQEVALMSAQRQLNNLQLLEQVEQLAKQLEQTELDCVALYMDNSIEWILADLAAMKIGLTLIPIPLFFSQQQTEHLINDAGIQAVITQSDLAATFNVSSKQELPGMQLLWLDAAHQTAFDQKRGQQLESVAKITYTSGSTGQPKGVCLSQDNLEKVTLALANSISGQGISRHLCVMPLATLLENIAGVYVPLFMGSSIHVEPLSSLGFTNSSGFDPQQFKLCLEQSQPHSVILLPQLLTCLIQLKQQYPDSFKSLKFAAVGGGKSALATIEQANLLGLPVYEGYGLSECASVVCLNNPGQNKPGSVGKVLPHTEVRISDEGEIIVGGQAMLGYLGQADLTKSPSHSEIHTGDLGYLDDEGYLYISGRKKNLLVSSFGRNISPEWVESEVLREEKISQVAIFGDAKPWLSAIITPATDDVSKREIQRIINNCNSQLPDYAQIKTWLLSHEAFSLENQQLTDNGRLRREVIFQDYQPQIDNLYIQAATNYQ